TRKSETKNAALLLQKNRLAEKPENVKPLDLRGQKPPGRRLITAEISTIKASLGLFGRGLSHYGTEFGWHVARKEGGKTMHNGFVLAVEPEVKYGNSEKVLLDPVEINYEQKVNPHCNHLGDYLMSEL